jgi:hypothetical protein
MKHHNVIMTCDFQYNSVGAVPELMSKLLHGQSRSKAQSYPAQTSYGCKNHQIHRDANLNNIHKSNIGVTQLRIGG